jgi:hypothetical protein
MKPQVQAMLWALGVVAAIACAATARFSSAGALTQAQASAEILIKPYEEWSERKGLKPRFTLDAEALTTLPQVTYVEAAKSEVARYDWRIWARVDQPTADFTVGLASAERRIFPRIATWKRLEGLTDLRRVSFRRSGSPDMLKTQFGDLEMQNFRVRGQSDTDKQCLGFYGTFENGTRAITGWYCARPNSDLRLSLVRCLIDRVAVEGQTVNATHVKPEC